ncbi:MAG TPA: LytR C-terminal domain-containing protein [Acidimicrobiales bacterium]|nr:LytR C-terminal domain-containing protein [Acidimicrobiales bacterium]
MSAASRSGNGSADHGAGGSFEPPDRARSGRGLAIVIVAVVIGVLLLPSATRAPLAASASTGASSGTGSSAGRTHSHGAGHSTSTTTSTSTTVPVASIHVLVANATATNGVAGSVTRFLASKGFSTLTATNALLKVTASEIYTVGGATADVRAVVAALSLPASSIEPAASAAPVASTTGANVVVIVGPDLATRFNPATTTTAATG